MAVYIYLPFSNVEFRFRALRWLAGRWWKGKTPTNTIYSSYSDFRTDKHTLISRTDQLANLTDNDKLYVLGHGDRDAVTICDSEDCNGRSYTPQVLAQLLQAERLSVGFIDLRIFSCDSGNPTDSNGVIRTCFAEALHEAMDSPQSQNRYARLRVSGYTGEVFETYKYRHEADPNSNAMTTARHKGGERLNFQTNQWQRVRASAIRVTFPPYSEAPELPGVDLDTALEIEV